MKKLLYIALALTALVGCNKEIDFGGENGDNAVKFTSEIAATRASGTTWDAADKIGITMYATATDNVSGSVENIGYKMTNTLGAFEPINASETIYYPVDGSKVDFVAYYPYSTTAVTSKKYSLDVTTQTTQSAIDFMLSNNLTDKGKSTSAQVLNFEHKLSNIVINAKAGGTLTDANLAGMTVKVVGTKLTATYDMTPSATTPIDFGSAVAQDVTLLYSAMPTYHAEGILIPQSWTAGDVVLEFTLAGLPNPFEVAVSDTKFESGKKYTYNVTVTPQKVILDVATITDWTAGNGATGEDLEATPPDYFRVNGIKVAKGNLVADGANGCKIGAPEDGGLYFQFGSLIGWSGSGSNDGTGRGTGNALSVVVKPASCTTAPSGWQNNNGSNINTLNNFYFNYSMGNYTTAGTDIRGFAETIAGAEATGTLADGRYAALGVGDPCSYYLGSTWRLPNKEEWKTIMGGSTGGAWSTADGWSATGTFGNGETGSYATHTALGLTIPASGYRDVGDGSLINVGSRGYCWSSSVCDANYGYGLNFRSSYVSPQNYGSRSFGFPVRCIQ